MKRPITLGLLALTALAAQSASHAQTFASSVVGYANLNPNPLYGNPNAALGQPTTLVFDGSTSTPDATSTYVRSSVFPAFNTAPDGSPLLASLPGATSSLTVKFDNPLVHDPSHWYGDDFIVFGNQLFSGQGADGNPYVTSPNEDLSTYTITDGSPNTSSALPAVSVSADGTHFVSVSPADSLYFPENPFPWVGVSAQNPTGWNENDPLNFTQPVNPDLTAADFLGRSASDVADTLYGGSAGGTAYSLAGTGLTKFNTSDSPGRASWMPSPVSASTQPALSPCRRWARAG